MAAKDCPSCGLTNPGSAQRCDCGYDFLAQKISREALAARAARKSAGKTSLVLGVAMLLGGVGLTVVGSSIEGGFVVFYGLIVAGVIAIGRGVLERSRI